MAYRKPGCSPATFWLPEGVKNLLKDTASHFRVSETSIGIRALEVELERLNDLKKNSRVPREKLAQKAGYAD